MTAETILSALQDGAKFHWQLPKLGNTDELIRLLEKRGKIIKEPDPKLGICRFRLFVRPKDQPEICRPSRKWQTWEQAQARKRLTDSKRIKCASCKARFARARFVVDGQLLTDCQRCRELRGVA